MQHDFFREINFCKLHEQSIVAPQIPASVQYKGAPASISMGATTHKSNFTTGSYDFSSPSAANPPSKNERAWDADF
jgi:hypothetical protein